MERYQEYKDSGIPWIGLIPKNWSLRRIKYIFTELKEKSDSGLESPLSLSKEKGIIPFSEKKNKTMESASYMGGKIVHKGEIVFNRFKARLFAVSGYDGIVSSDYAVYKCSQTASAEYMVKLFGTEMYREAFNRKASGIGDGFSRLYSDDLFAMYSIFPPLPEQEKIVNYLESKTLIIDAYVAERERELRLLNELKEAEIAHVVTQGLNPDMKMKDSGIPWIGMIPEHWEVEPFGRHFTFGKGLPITKADLLSEGTAVISYGQIHAKTNTGVTMDESLVRRVSPSYLETHPQCLLQKDDFVFADTSEDLEGSGNFAFNDYEDDIFAGYHTLVAKPIDLLYPKYYAYLFQSTKWKSQVRSLVNGVKVYTISKRILKNSYILIPTLKEQQEIVAYADEKCAKVNSLIAELNAEIEYLKEYKQSLIADVVTGQVNVQNERELQ